MTAPPIEALLAVKPVPPAVQARLVVEFDRLLWQLARRLHRRPAGRRLGDPEDLHAEAAILLLDAAERFDPARPSRRTGAPVKFQTYATDRVWGMLRGRARRRSVEAVPMPTAAGGPAWEPAAPAEPDAVELAELRAALASLPERSRAVLRLLYEAGLSARAAGRALGLGEGVVRRVERKAVEELARLVGGLGRPGSLRTGAAGPGR